MTNTTEVSKFIYFCSTNDIYFIQMMNELMEQQRVGELRAKLITSPYIKEGVLERYDVQSRKMATIDTPLKHKFQL